MYITEKRLFKWALYSNAMYVVLLFLFRPNGLNPLKVAITSMLLFSVFSVFLLGYKNRKQLKEIPKFARVVFYCLLFYGGIVIIRGFSLSLQDWLTNFGNVYMAFAWLVPTVLILGLKIENWNVLFKAINFMFQLMILTFFISPFYDVIKTEWTWLLRPVNFILLMGLYRYKFINKLKIFLVIAIYIVIAIRVDQRMEFLYLALVIGFLMLDKLFTFKVKRRFLKYIFGGFILVFTLIFTVGYEFVSSMISIVFEYKDTRTFLYKELYGDMSIMEKLFGRGSLGTYYSEFFENTRKHYVRLGYGWAGDAADRITTEVGYLQMILKGGFVLLISNIVLIMYATYVAVFRSRNTFIRRLGYYILILSILSLVSFRPAFTPTFIVLWMAIGTVLCKKYRMMNDAEINELIKF